MKNNFKGSEWHNKTSLQSKSFICCNCGEKISSNTGYKSIYDGRYTSHMAIYICHSCNAPNVFDSNNNFVGNVIKGKDIKKLPDDIKCVYNEARTCLSVGAYTAAVMLFRKILMNVSVEEGAEEGNNFKYYLSYLCKEGLVHKRQTKQAEKVKDLGNDANHKIECRTKEEAEMLFKFVEQFLITNYEFADEDESNDK